MVWYEALKGYEYASVHRALDQWLISQSKPPAISDIRILCRPMGEVYKALPNKRTPDQLEKAKNMANTVNNLVKPVNRDWVAYWHNILAHKSELPSVCELFAKQALVNLGAKV